MKLGFHHDGNSFVLFVRGGRQDLDSPVLETPMNDDRSERPGEPSSSSEPLNVTETSPASGDAPKTPEVKKGASSGGAASIVHPETKPSNMPDAATSAPSESPSESQQSPPTEPIPIAPGEPSTASNGSDSEQQGQPRPGSEEADGLKDNNNHKDGSRSGAADPPHHPPPPLPVVEPPAVPKVKIHLVAVGSAPILKRTKFQIGACKQPFL
jgi:hypothetical protein